MSPFRLVLTGGAAAACLLSSALTAVPVGASELATGHAGPPAGVVPATANAHAARSGASTSSNLVYHGGPVMHGTAVTPIFWGTSWSPTADKVTGLGTFYAGVGGSTYAKTNTEYSDGSGFVSPAVTPATAVFDSSAAPRRAPQTSTILNEVAKKISNPVANGYYPVYVDTPRGHTGYCAWHSAGTINGVVVQFAFFFNLDNDPGCDPQDTTSGHSQGLAALANVSGHELSEMLTDRHLDAWYDSSGAENSDKCAWTFGSHLLSFGGTSWKIQGNWSNAAYDANQGYGGHRGCIDGTN